MGSVSSALSGTQQWLDARRLGVGSSDAAGVLAEKYGCPRALYFDKAGVQPDYSHTERELALFERGHALEPIVCQSFAKDTGLKVRRMPTRINADRPWMRANLDRCIETVDERGPGYLEAKTASDEVFDDMLAEGIPSHYVLQMQHGLAVTGWKWGYFAVRALPSWRKLYVEVKRDENLIAVLNQVEDSFWQQVQRGLIPAKLADFDDARCKKCLFRLGCRNAEAIPAKPRVKPNYQRDDHPDLVRLVGALKQTDTLIEELEIARGEYRDGIKALLGDRTHVAVPECGVKLNLGEQSGRLTWDSRALDADHPELAPKYKRRGEPITILRVYHDSGERKAGRIEEES